MISHKKKSVPTTWADLLCTRGSARGSPAIWAAGRAAPRQSAPKRSPCGRPTALVLWVTSLWRKVGPGAPHPGLPSAVRPSPGGGGWPYAFALPSRGIRRASNARHRGRVLFRKMNFLFGLRTSLFGQENSLLPGGTGNWLQAIELARRRAPKTAPRGQHWPTICEIPCYFP